MKKVIIVGIMFMMFMGVVSAASINGDYKGNPIVTIYSDSTEVKPDDVPALIYNGRTVVPISMLKKIGLKVTWNQEDYSVDVNFPDGTVTNTVDYEVETLKLKSRIQNNFYKIETLGETINSISQYLSLANDSISANHNIVKSFSNANNFISNTLTKFGVVVSDTASILKEAQGSNIDIMVMKDVLTSYSDSLELYMVARDGLTDYSNSKKTTDFSAYLDNYSDAYDKVIDALNKANKGYNDYFNEIQN